MDFIYAILIAIAGLIGFATFLAFIAKLDDVNPSNSGIFVLVVLGAGLALTAGFEATILMSVIGVGAYLYLRNKEG